MHDATQSEGGFLEWVGYPVRLEYVVIQCGFREDSLNASELFHYLVMDIDNLPGGEGLHAEEVFTNREQDCDCSRQPVPFLYLVMHIISV